MNIKRLSFRAATNFLCRKVGGGRYILAGNFNAVNAFLVMEERSR